MGWFKDLFSRPVVMHFPFEVGNDVFVNKVVGAGHIPSHTKGKIIKDYGSGIYGVEIEGYPYGNIGYAIFDYDMELNN